MNYNFRVIKAIFVEAGSYNDMVVRPYETNFTQSNVNAFKEATNYGGNISSSNISGVATSFLRPSVGLLEHSAIDQGWQAPRFRYILELEFYSHLSPGYRKIIQGYTNHLGVNFSTGSIDPNMVLYFNNVVTLNYVNMQTPAGIYTNVRVANADQIIRGVVDFSFTGESVVTKSLRPNDIFNKMSHFDYGDDTLDLTGGFADTPLKKSKRRNGVPSMYLADVMKGYQGGFSEGGFSSGIDQHDAFGVASGLVKENQIGSDDFFRTLQSNTANFTTGGFITYSELVSLTPEMDSKITIVPAKTAHQQTALLHSGGLGYGQGEHWQGSNNETMWASIMTQSIPGLMLDLLITKLAFTAHNRTTDSSHDIRITYANSFSEGIDLQPYLAVFVTKFETEILRGLTLNNHLDYALVVSVDIVGETRISISVMGQPAIEYVAPSFADGLYSCLTTHDAGAETRLAHDLSTFCGEVGVSNPTFAQHNTQGGYHGGI